MTPLEIWLKQATRHLSAESVAVVQKEIQDHYELAREEAICAGAGPREAEQTAISTLGDAKIANFQYRNALLTSAEAKLLRQAQWEGKAFCSRRWLKWMLLAFPTAVLVIAGICLLKGEIDVAQTLLIGGIGMSLWWGVPFLPVYTPSRARIFRCLRWLMLLGVIGFAFGSSALQWSWLLSSCLWPLAWVEWQRASIRRKLPVSDWPRMLYL